MIRVFSRGVRYPLAVLLAYWLAGTAQAAEGFQHYVAGNPGDVVTDTRGLLVLQGGGDDVDANYTRMAAHAGGGDFVVLRASGADEYNAYIHALCDCDSVETIVFDDRNASYDAFVIRRIRNAEAVFIAGGDQSRYIRFWKGTPVQDAIEFVAAKPAPVGGTSAGMAILGEFSYSAMGDASLTADAALANPFTDDLTLTRAFLSLPVLKNTITDQHLLERDRIGRAVVFLARLLERGWTGDARAIAADRETALHIDPETGVGTVYARPGHTTPFVYFLRATERPEQLQPETPLTWKDIEVHRAGPGDHFDVRHWRDAGSRTSLSYTLTSVAGVLAATKGSVYGFPTATADKRRVPQ